MRKWGKYVEYESPSESIPSAALLESSAAAEVGNKVGTDYNRGECKEKPFGVCEGKDQKLRVFLVEPTLLKASKMTQTSPPTSPGRKEDQDTDT